MSSGHYGFWGKMFSHLNCCSYLGNVSFLFSCFQEFLKFIFSFQHFVYGGSSFGFLWVYLIFILLSVLNVWIYVSKQFGKLLAIISSKFGVSISFSYLFETLITWMLHLMRLYHIHFFSSVLQIEWFLLITLQGNWILNLSSVIFILLLSTLMRRFFYFSILYFSSKISIAFLFTFFLF